jgi:K+-transporting ATPase ATPase A chain
MRNTLRASIIATLMLAALTGLAYPMVVTGIAQLAFPHQANGSPIRDNGAVVGSELIGQSFTGDQYFHPRPSAAGAGYDAMASGGSNLGPSNPVLLDRVNASAAQWRANETGAPPVDAVTTSASGLDPHITIANALGQAPRVARARALDQGAVEALIRGHTDQRDLGFLGEPGVNVLELNLALAHGQTSSLASAPAFGPNIAGPLQGLFWFALVLGSSILGARWLARLFKGREVPMPRTLGRLEALLLKPLGKRGTSEMTWKEYTWSVLGFSAVSFGFTYLVLRLQGFLPWNPHHVPGVRWDIALNTAISFGSNTNWQAYAGESTMSHLTQMLGLTFQNFVSAAVGMAVALALIRGISRHGELGNFWSDLIRCTVYILLPVSIIMAVFFVWQGVPQTLDGSMVATTLEGGHQEIALGPVASQLAIKILGTNGGGFFNANSAHPFENPTPLTNLVQMALILVLPGAFLLAFGRLCGRPKEGWVLWIVCAILLVAGVGAATWAEQNGNPAVHALGVDDGASNLAGGGNMEGKEVRFGNWGSALYAAITAATSCGSVNSMHDSFMPLGGGVPLLLILLGEVVFGGVGAGFYSLMIFVMLAVFLSGLMIGRTPEYLGNRLGAFDVKMVLLAVMAAETTVLGFAALGVIVPQGLAGIFNPGAHGFTEVLYGYGSAVGNNGSAFGGLGAALPWFTVTMAIAMFIGRFMVIIPVLALAGSMARKELHPATVGTFPTDGGLFGGILIGVILIVGALTFFPALVLGPILEHLHLFGGA